MNQMIVNANYDLADMEEGAFQKRFSGGICTIHFKLQIIKRASNRRPAV